MGRINLVIADEDIDFGEALSAYLINHYSNIFKTRMFSKKDLLEVFLDNYKNDEFISPKIITVLMVSDFMFEITCEKYLKSYENRGLIFIRMQNREDKYKSGGEMVRNNIDKVSEYKKTMIGLESFNKGIIPEIPEKKMNIEVNYLNKYNKATYIAEKVIEITNALKLADNRDTGKNKVFSAVVASSCGGVGKTVLSLALCAYFLNAGKKVLYLPLEAIPSLIFRNPEFKNNKENTNEVPVDNYSGRNLSEAVFSMKDNPDTFLLSMKDIFCKIFHTNIESIYHSAFAGEFTDYAMEDYIRILKIIKDYSGCHDIIIVDTQTSDYIAFRSLIKLCSKFILLTDETMQNIPRTQYLLDSLQKDDEAFNHLDNKLITVINSHRPDNQGNSIAFNNIPKKARFNIPYCNCARSFDRIIKTDKWDSQFKSAIDNIAACTLNANNIFNGNYV